MILSDEKIIELFWRRDENALKMTAEQYGRYCTSISMGILHDSWDAEECVNDAYLRLWNSIPPARPPVLRAFLGRIVRNLALDRYRRNHRARRDRDQEVSLEELMDELGDCFPADEEISCTGLDALHEYLSDFLEQETPLNRKLFVGRYWYNYSLSVLASYYGLTEGAADVRLRRTRARLRVYLEERGIGL